MYSFPLRNAASARLNITITIIYAVAVIITMVLGHQLFLSVTKGSIELGIIFFALSLMPLLPVLFLASKRRLVTISEEEITVTSGRKKVQRIPLGELGHLSVTGSNRTLKVIDRNDNEVLLLRPFIGSSKIDPAVDYLCELLPHMEHLEAHGREPLRVIHRYVDFLTPEQLLRNQKRRRSW